MEVSLGLANVGREGWDGTDFQKIKELEPRTVRLSVCESSGQSLCSEPHVRSEDRTQREPRSWVGGSE